MPLLKKRVAQIILFSLLLKVLYIVFAVLVSKVDSDFYFTLSANGITELFQRNDTYWYKTIHEDGYPEVHSKRDLGWHDGADYYQSSWGFMPGYPMVTQTVSAIFGTDFTTSAFLISVLFSLSCFLLFYWLATLWFLEEKNAFFATLLFMAMPFQYYFSMYYTEAYFCTLLLGAVVAAQKRKYMILAVLTSLMVLVRANGLVMLLPLTMVILEREKVIIGTKINATIWSWDVLKKCTFLLLPICTFAGYIVYQYVQTGFPFAYSIAQQAGWYRKMVFPFAGLFTSSDFTVQFNSIYAIVFMVIALFAWRKLPLSYNFIVWLNILLPLSAGTSVGMPRYISIIFPLFFVFSFWLKNANGRSCCFRYLSASNFLCFISG